VDGYVFPLSIRDGLPYLGMRPYTDVEYESLPHVILTSDVDWDPQVLDFDIDDKDDWCDAISNNVNHSELFDAFGDYKDVRPALKSHLLILGSILLLQISTPGFNWRKPLLYVPNMHIVYIILTTMTSMLFSWSTIPNLLIPQVQSRKMMMRLLIKICPTPNRTLMMTIMLNRIFKVKDPDYDKLRPLFGWMNTKTIKKKIKQTTQYARLPNDTILKKHYKSPFPALNVQRCDEPVATGTVYSDTPAIDGGETCAQIFVGTGTMVTDV
jgi:hypothetical protein